MIKVLDSNKIFRRGQLETAAWRFLAGSCGVNYPPNSSFRARIKRVLNLDREGLSGNSGVVSETPYAFSSFEPEGKGTEAAYTHFDAVCLTIALELLDCGFKQSEVVFLLRHIRKNLEKVYLLIMKTPPNPRQKCSIEEYPDSPTFEEKNFLYADLRVFMLIERVELTDIYKPGPDRGKTTPSIPVPVICYGIEQLQEELQKMNFDFRKVLIMEIAEMSVMLLNELKKAPLVRRGRK
jgi:hypothetical protein